MEGLDLGLDASHCYQKEVLLIVNTVASPKSECPPDPGKSLIWRTNFYGDSLVGLKILRKQCSRRPEDPSLVGPI